MYTPMQYVIMKTERQRSAYTTGHATPAGIIIVKIVTHIKEHIQIGQLGQIKW